MNSHVGSWSPGGLLNLQRTIAKVKTHCLDEFVYHWKAIETKMYKMGLHDPFGHLKHKLWSKERSKVKLAI
jgi:hypothetical protein